MSKDNLIKLDFKEPPEFCKALREIAESFQDYDGIEETAGILLVRYPDGQIDRFSFGDTITFREAHSILTWTAQDVFLHAVEDDYYEE